MSMRIKVMPSLLRIVAGDYRIRKTLRAAIAGRYSHAAEYAQTRPFEADRVLVLVIEQVVGVGEHGEPLVRLVIWPQIDRRVGLCIQPRNEDSRVTVGVDP